MARPMRVAIFANGTAQRRFAEEIFTLNDIGFSVVDSVPPDHEQLWLPDIGPGSQCGFTHAIVCGAWADIKEEITSLIPAPLISALHPDATISQKAVVWPGSIVNARAVILNEAVVGIGCMIHAGVVVSHDCQIGDFANLSPGCILGGSVEVGKGATIGMGVTIYKGVKIGAGATIHNGVDVFKDVPEGKTVKARVL